MDVILDELVIAIQRVFREFVPPPQDREPLTWSKVPNALSYVIPYLFMAYLVRREGTHLIRLLLLPTIVAMALRCTYRYYIPGREYYFHDWCRGLMSLTVIAKSIDFAFVKNGRFKVGEKRLRGRPGEPDTRTAAEGREAYTGILPEAIQDALDVGLSLRGINWDFGRGVYIPPPTQPQERVAFLKDVGTSLWQGLLLLDFYDSVIKSIPGVGSSRGGSIFFAGLPLVPRYVVSTGIHILTGTFIVLGLECTYYLASLVGVGLLNQPITSWPGLLDHPWKSESLHELWAKRWHQCLKQVFLIYGGYPGQFIAGNIGMVLGSFLASGVFHEFGAYVIDRPMDHRVTLFFLLQGVGVVLESIWRRLTGRRVGGWCGRVWTFFFMLVLGQICTDAWAIRGLGGSLLIPSFMSPTRALLFPALRRRVPHMTELLRETA